MSVSCRTPVTSTQCQGIKLHTWRDLHAYMRRLLSGSTRSRRDGEWLSWTAPQCLRQEDLNSKPDPCQCPVYVQAPKAPQNRPDPQPPKPESYPYTPPNPESSIDPTPGPERLVHPYRTFIYLCRLLLKIFENPTLIELL